jgi:hypothetical protein
MRLIDDLWHLFAMEGVFIMPSGQQQPCASISHYSHRGEHADHQSTGSLL